ncbi:hypothetical protein LTR66_015102 [Elasticomyces elasticus]|nr:hypothetical protein LTR66_015102 [Elasticomyces elasticus]
MKPAPMVGGSQRGRMNPFPALPMNDLGSNASVNTMISGDSYTSQTRYMEPRRERFIDELEIERPTLAARRSRKFSLEDDNFRFPEPITTYNLPATPALDSRNTTQSSDIPTPASDMHILDPALLDRQRKRGKRTIWNPFRRKESISEVDERPGAQIRSPSHAGVEVTLVSTARPKRLPYYAMTVAEPERTTAERIGQYLQEAAQSSPEKSESQSVTTSIEQDLESTDLFRESLLLPKAPSRRTSFAPQMATIPAIIAPVANIPVSAPSTNQTVPQTQRQPRLAQAGRIPKVVSSRQQLAPTVMASQPAIASLYPPKTHTVRRVASREQLPRLNTTVLNLSSKAKSRIRTEVVTSTAHITQSRPARQEFLEFPEARNSDFTTSSESTGVISIMGPPLSTEAQSATASAKRRTDKFTRQDERWKTLPKKSPKLPKQAARKTKDNNSTRGPAIVPAPIPSARPQKQFLAPPHQELSTMPSLQELNNAEDIRLRRSRIQEALRPSFAPSSPFSMRDFLDEYGRPVSRPVSKTSDRLSNLSSQDSNAHKKPSSIVEEDHDNARALVPLPAKPVEPQIDRAHASLMVSRWLSFGRVLFSPAHTEITTTPERHILVIDGLGTEDWSIYCANTYRAENAYVHDFRERRSLRARFDPQANSIDVPPNHRRALVSSFQERFPFPPAFFACIVIRFPGSMPDAKLKNLVSECRRVLAPGGYLELMILDLDVVNMGVTTRRAIKDLKIKMAAEDRDVSLKPIIDNVSTVLGSNGFSNLSRCVVGVPVVGKPANSLDSSSESRSSGGSMTKVLSNTSTTSQGHTRHSSAGPRPYGSLAGSSAADFSLNDLVADHSENADARIGRMVSRTARSWWQTCFENGMEGRSILAKKEVLNECKTRAANFKLLIAYTQKPVLERGVGNRRTMSEPVVPTLAIAGGVGRI